MNNIRRWFPLRRAQRLAGPQRIFVTPRYSPTSFILCLTLGEVTHSKLELYELSLTNSYSYLAFDDICDFIFMGVGVRPDELVGVLIRAMDRCVS